MPPTRTDIIEVVTQLAAAKNLQVVVTEAAKVALNVGGSAFIGALLGGPIGLGIGGTIGSIAAAFNGHGKCKSVVEVIRFDMLTEHINNLADSVMGLIQNINSRDVLVIVVSLSTNQLLRELVIKEIGNFLTNLKNLIFKENELNN